MARQAPEKTRGDDVVLAGALCAGATQREAASLAGVSVRTVRRRLREPGFSALLQALADEAQRRVALAVGDGALEAAATLRAMLGADTPPGVRLRAAQTLLAVHHRLREQRLEERLVALEASIVSLTHPWPEP
jgi:hypothetical protein